jgi:hypothetical protein
LALVVSTPEGAAKRLRLSMPLWLRAVEFAIWWTVLGAAAFGACAAAARASRSSFATGVEVRVAASLALGILGVVVGYHDVLTLGCLVGNDYRYLLPSWGWYPWIFGAAAAAIPWLAWRFGSRK